MTSVSALVDGVIGREGGYSNHPADRGGPTRWGVTQAVARAHGYQGDMRQYPREEAVKVYTKQYWNAPGLDLIALHAPLVAAEMFDTGVNMGPATAVRFLRRALNALNRGGADYRDVNPQTPNVDRELDVATASFIRVRGAEGERVLLKALEGLQAERYITIAENRPANEAFVYGWLANRIG